jgi:hypothetical protein
MMMANHRRIAAKQITGALGMIARGLATAVLLALAMAGTADAQVVTGVDNMRPDASAAPATVHDSAATAAVGDASGAPATGTSTTGAVSKSTTEDAALPNAPQAKAGSPQTKPVAGYTRPTHKVKLVNYLFDAFGPYPIVAAGLVAGINQARNSPRDWDQGMTGFGRRWGSNYGIGAITTSTRYGLADLFREDTLYYRCECSGFLPRLRHAVLSTVTARRGQDGHREFSVPALVAPYVGEQVAVHAWYPQRYDSMDAFRQANYSLLVYAGQNIAFEFLPNGPHSLLAKFHLQNRRFATEPSN